MFLGSFAKEIKGADICETKCGKLPTVDRPSANDEVNAAVNAKLNKYHSCISKCEEENTNQQDEQFCNEWAKYIDAFDMVSPSKKELPYSMEKYNGDMIKGAMVFGETTIFVPEPSQSLLKTWPNPNIPIILKEKMDKFYDAKNAYNKKVSDLYKEKGNDQAINLIRTGAFKSDGDKIVALAKDIQEIAKGKGNDDTIKTCFNAYQKLSHERFKNSNFQEFKYAGAIRSLNDDLQNCQMGSKITDTNRYNVKTIDEIVEQVLRKTESFGVQK